VKYPTKSELVASGYVSVGDDGRGYEVMCAYCGDDETTIRYHLLRGGESVWEYPQTVGVSQIPIFVKMLNALR
jgi:hypothetical protein